MCYEHGGGEGMIRVLRVGNVVAGFLSTLAPNVPQGITWDLFCFYDAQCLTPFRQTLLANFVASVLEEFYDANETS